MKTKCHFLWGFNIILRFFLAFSNEYLHVHVVKKEIQTEICISSLSWNISNFGGVAEGLGLRSIGGI